MENDNWYHNVMLFNLQMEITSNGFLIIAISFIDHNMQIIFVGEYLLQIILILTEFH